MSGRVEGKRVIVVGAGQQPGPSYGNGRAIACLFAKEGAEVFAVDLFADRVEATVNEMQELGAKAHAYTANVSKPDECESLIDAAHATMGRIDVLVNNVGIIAGDTNAFDLTTETWDKIFDTNVKSMWLTSRRALTYMREQGSGVITNISSTASQQGTTQYFAYGVSKAAVNALGHALARDNAKFGIRINTVLPGSIATPLGIDRHVADGEATNREEIIARRASVVPMGHTGTAWDVANAVLYLSCDESAFVTGQLIRIDGGSGTMLGTVPWQKGVT